MVFVQNLGDVIKYYILEVYSMCYSAKASVIAFLIDIICGLYLILFPKANMETKITGLILIGVGSMQLAELLIHLLLLLVHT